MSLAERITNALSRERDCRMVDCEESVEGGEDYCEECKRLCQQVGRSVNSMRRSRGDGR